MNLLDRLATALGRRDEVPNQVLAKQIAQKKDKAAVSELIIGLQHKDKNIQSDCLKVLYEIGNSTPGLITDHLLVFIDLLKHKNNRMVWGAMIALDKITSLKPETIYKHLGTILKVADEGSVITKDHAVNILIQLAGVKKYSDQSITLLIDILKSCATNQLPMYAENSLPIINDKFKNQFVKILQSRIPEIDKESKVKRVEKVIKKFQ